MLPELWRTWCHEQSCGEPVPMPDPPLCEELFPNVHGNAWLWFQVIFLEVIQGYDFRRCFAWMLWEASVSTLDLTSQNISSAFTWQLASLQSSNKFNCVMFVWLGLQASIREACSKEQEEGKGIKNLTYIERLKERVKKGQSLCVWWKRQSSRISH